MTLKRLNFTRFEVHIKCVCFFKERPAQEGILVIVSQEFYKGQTTYKKSPKLTKIFKVEDSVKQNVNY